MRIYNITTESKFKGMYISEDDCGRLIYSACVRAGVLDLVQIERIGQYASLAIYDLYSIEPHVVMSLGTVQHGNKNCVRLPAICAILAQVLNIRDTEIMHIAHDLTEEWEDVEIEIGEEN